MVNKDRDAASPSTSIYRTVTSEIVRFLSNANSTTLTGCFVVLALITHAILGRLGLLLIGAVLGAFAHASLQLVETPDGSIAITTKQQPPGLEVASKLLAWQGRKTGTSGEMSGNPPSQTRGPKIGPASEAALERFEIAMIQDYVKSWYSKILPDKSFEQSCRQTLSNLVLSISYRLSQKRPADAFLNFSTNIASILLVFLNELSVALSTNHEEPNVQKTISLYLEQNPESHLASILDKEEQGRKLKGVADDFLQTFLESDSVRCEPVRVFLRETLAGVALESVLTTCSQPGWINDWIVYLLEGDEPELMYAIDANLPAQGDIVNPDSAANAAHGSKEEEQQTAQKIASDRTPSFQGPGKADQAVEIARRETQRLSELIAQETGENGHPDLSGASTNTTEPSATPTSSQSDLLDASDDGIYTGSSEPSSSILPAGPSTAQKEDSFTRFDQILQPSRANPQVMQPPALTLLEAKISILDDGPLSGKHLLKSKPSSTEYLLQVEPASTLHPGWIITRKYAQFEALHEYISRIAIVSGVQGFPYRSLPTWKSQTKESLRVGLERYLGSALAVAPLAECEAMRRFLAKDRATGNSSTPKGVLGFPHSDSLQTIGKGMLGALASAPTGGKAIIDGVSGVFGGVRKPGSMSLRRDTSDLSVQGPAPSQATSLSRASLSTGRTKVKEVSISDRNSYESVISRPALPKRPNDGGAESQNTDGALLNDAAESHTPLHRTVESKIARSNTDFHSSTSSIPPSIDFGPEPANDQPRCRDSASQRGNSDAPRPASDVYAGGEDKALEPNGAPADTHSAGDFVEANTPRASHEHIPLTTEEAGVAIELLFAVVNELFSLTTVWSVRRTFLNAAKAYVLRPGNLGLETIRKLLQTSVIDVNTVDDSIAAHITKLRENALPTEEELKLWPPPRAGPELEKLQTKARDIFVEKALPQALIGIMGSASSNDALGKVFDALQIEEVSRGLIFAVLLQTARVLIY